MTGRASPICRIFAIIETFVARFVVFAVIDPVADKALRYAPPVPARKFPLVAFRVVTVLFVRRGRLAAVGFKVADPRAEDAAAVAAAELLRGKIGVIEKKFPWKEVKKRLLTFAPQV